MYVNNLHRLFSLKAILLPVTFLLLSLPAAPSSAEDLLHYYNLALNQDPQLRGARYRTLATRETLRQAKAGLLPRLYGYASYTHTFQDVRRSDNPVYEPGTSDYGSQLYGATLTQPLFHYSSFLTLRQARTVLDRSSLDLEKARQDLALRVVEAYLNVQLAKDKLDAVRAEESAVDLHNVVARERFERGMARITDRHDAEARLAAVRAQRVEAEYFLKDALQSLAEITGEQAQAIKLLKEELPLTTPFPENSDYWAEAAARQNLEVRIQRANAEIAGKEVEIRKSAHYPTLDFQADANNSITKGSLFGGGSNTMNYDLMVRLNIPFYEGGVTTSRTREAANLYQSALEDVTREKRAAERAVRATYNGVVSAMTRVEAMKKSVAAQKLVVDAKEEGFKSGLYISLAVLDAMQDLYKYRKELSLARHDYILSSMKLKHTVGTLNDEEVGWVNGWLQE